MGLTINSSLTLRLLSALGRSSLEQAVALQRLSTGRRINRGADDPSGLIAYQSLMSESQSAESAIASIQRASSFISATDGALAEISRLIGEIETLVSRSANTGALTQSEISANQSQIDAAIDSIDRIVRNTTFNGARLLDGSQAIQVLASNPSKVADARAFSRRASSSGDVLAINVQQAASVASAALLNNPASISAASFSIAGRLGVATIDVADGESLAAIRDRVVATAGQTGVSASLVGGAVRLVSRDYGSSAFVQVSRISGDSDIADVARTTGRDASVVVGGQQAFADGLRVSFSAQGVSGEFLLTAAGNAAGSAGNFTVSGGGATFQLGSGASSQVTIGIQSVASFALGDAAAGYLSSLKSGGENDLSRSGGNALAVARAALEQVTRVQGRLGGFQRFQLQAGLSSLTAARDALNEAAGLLGDADFAVETARLNRQRVLIQASTTLLGVAQQQAQVILSLLR